MFCDLIQSLKQPQEVNLLIYILVRKTEGHKVKYFI